MENLRAMARTAVAAANKEPGDLHRYRVPILDRTLDLVELLSCHPDGLSLTEMTEALRQPKNSVFRIAATLTLRGYAERLEPGKRYRLTRQWLSLGHRVAGGERLVKAAGPVLLALRDETGETALLGTLSGGHGVVLDQVPSAHPVKVVVEPGHSFPLHTAAPAKAMVAFLPPPVREVLTRNMSFQRRTPHTITTLKAYLKELETVRTCGWAVDRGEESETYTCAAAPVFDRRGTVVAALWISGPADRLQPAHLPRWGEVVRRHAQALGAAL